MFKNYFKTAYRIFIRQKEYTAINVGGLALAMAVCLLTLAWAQYEFSYDRFHKNADQIYRFIAQEKDEDGLSKDSGAPLPLAAVLKESFPEVAEVTRLRSDPSFWERIASPKNVDFRNAVLMADPAVLSMFDFPLLKGDPRTALNDQDSILLTESAAKKYFGDANPVGQRLLFTEKKIPMIVTGVMKDIPETSHLQFQMLTNVKAVDLWWTRDPKSTRPPMWEDWTLASYDMYVRLAPGASPADLEAKISRLLRDQGPEIKYTLSLQPLTQIHLHSSDFTVMGLNIYKRPDIGRVYLFLSVALIILLMACINYSNLSTARSIKRSKEIGVRKVNGASRGDIIRQFLGESMIFAFAALFAALVLAAALFPILQKLSGQRLDLGLLSRGQILLSLLGVALFTGFISGIYPALFISRFAPVQAMKETGKSRGRSFINIRRVLVIAQVVCSVGLVVATAVFSLQLRYLRTKDLGFDRRNILVTGFAGEWEQLGPFKEELLRFPGIKNVTYGIAPTMGSGGHAFGSGDYGWEGKSAEARINFDFVFVDEDYLKIYNSAMAQGRFFSKEFATDKNNYVLNESAIRAMGLKDPIGKSFSMGKRTGQIIGVVKDFHTSTLRAAIKPTLFRMSLFSQASIRFDPNQTQAVIRHLETVWKKFVPEQPLAFAFLEDTLDQLYEGDRSVSLIVSLFGLLSLIIAGLGLYGLVAFAAEQKTKEIGIRKVLGATVVDIVRFMSKEFSILVGAAIVLALPLGYYIGARWLGGFAYRIPLSWWIFAGSGAVVFTVTFLTMSWQAVKAAVANPVHSLRSE